MAPVSRRSSGRDEAARIEELRIGAEPAAWADLGFTVAGEELRIGATPLRLTGAGAGVGWSVSGLGGELDGLPTELVEPGPASAPGSPAEHPNGALAIDHLVVFTPQLERTLAAFEAAGVRCRRIREVGPPPQQLRQGFLRFGEVIVEVVEVPSDQAGPGAAARFWGLTLTVADLDRLVAELGDRCGTVRDAVQPDRRIATIRKQAGLGLPVALITPQPPKS
jgi:hypothetical protein